MKTLFCILVCMASVLAFGQGMNEPPRLPAGFRHPSVYPPGPEREAAEKQLEQHRRAARAWGEGMMAARRAAEKPNPFVAEIKTATRVDGSIDHSKLSPKTSDRLDALAAASVVDSTLKGPSKRLVVIVGERPPEELARIVEAVSEVSLQQTVRKYPFESVARAVRQLVGNDIKLTDEQLRALLAVDATALNRLNE